MNNQYSFRNLIPKMLHLNWNDHPSSLSNSAKDMKDDKDFMDVTLAFDDNEQIRSSKFMLSICSPFFRRILKRNSHLHPLIYLKGIKSGNMRKIIDFIFHGEICVFEEELDAFLETAKDLEFNGLSAATPIEKSANILEENIKDATTSTIIKTIKSEPQVSEAEAWAVELWETNVDKVHSDSKLNTQMNYVDVKKAHFPVDPLNDGNKVRIEPSSNDIKKTEVPYIETLFKEDDETMCEAFIEKNLVILENGLFKCKECGKVFLKRHVLKIHIQSHLAISCKICQRTFATKGSLKTHISTRVCTKKQ